MRASSSSSSRSSPAAPPPSPPRAGAGDAEAESIVGWGGPGFGQGPFNPPPVWLPPVPSPVPAAEPKESPPPGAGVPRFALDALAVGISGPLFLYFMVWLVGLSVLPAYYGHFEQAETPAKPC